MTLLRRLYARLFRAADYPPGRRPPRCRPDRRPSAPIFEPLEPRVLMSGTVTLTVQDVQVVEPRSVKEYRYAHVTVTASGPSDTGWSVQYAITGGTAEKDFDYERSSDLTLTVPAGRTSGDFLFQIINDAQYEGDEVFFVTLVNPIGAELGDRVTAQVTIADLWPPAISYGVQPGLIGPVKGRMDGGFKKAFWRPRGARWATAQQVVIAPDGAIVSVAKVNIWDELSWWLVRHRPSGRLDRAFGQRGSIRTDLREARIAMEPDGKIIVAGERQYGRGVGVVRYNKDGSIDPSFADDGTGAWRTGALSGESSSTFVARDNFLLPDGKFLIAGTGPAGLAVMRLLPDGSPDHTFGDNGVATTEVAGGPFHYGGAAIGPEGSVVLAGYGTEVTTLIRYRNDGVLDGTFGGGYGVVKVRPGSGYWSPSDVLIRPDGRILVSVENWEDGAKIGLMEFAADGRFARFVANRLGPKARAFSIALQEDGKIVVAGRAGGGKSRMALGRYQAEIARPDRRPPSLPLTVDGRTWGRIDSPGQSVLYSFPAVKGQSVSIQAAWGDTTLRLLDSDGKTVLLPAPGDDAPPVDFEWTAPRKGTYYLQVSGVDQFAGRFFVNMFISDPPGPHLPPRGESVTARFRGGTLAVRVRDDAYLELTVDDGVVKVNGYDPRGGPVQPEKIRKIVVRGGAGDNVFDLRQITDSSGFGALDGKIMVFGGGGNDTLHSSWFIDKFDGGAGHDVYMDGDGDDLQRKVEWASGTFEWELQRSSSFRTLRSTMRLPP